MKRGGSFSFLVGTISNVLVMEIGWTDVGSRGYILVSNAHSNTSIKTNTIIFNAGLLPEKLVSKPNDKHLFRLAKCIDINECTSFFEKLGLSSTTWNNIRSQYPHETTVSTFFALYAWKGHKKKNDLNPSFQELSDALSAGGYTVHLLCKVGNNCSHR